MPPRARARALSPEQRRDQLVDVTLDLLRLHGRAVSTRQIAERAGVAEGTIFRVVDSKEELVDLAISRAFEPGPFVDRVLEIDRDQPLAARLTALVAIMQQRFRATFGLIRQVGLLGPPDHDSEAADAWRTRLQELLVDLVGDDARRLSIPADAFVHRLRLLTFAGSHDQIADGRLLTPEQVVETLLHGHLRPAGEEG